jgi:hypothetical protein
MKQQTYFVNILLCENLYSGKLYKLTVVESDESVARFGSHE